MKKWVRVLKDKKNTFGGSIEIKPNSDLKELELFDNDNEDFVENRFMKPPVLFKLPSIKCIKNLIYKYLDLKKKI